MQVWLRNRERDREYKHDWETERDRERKAEKYFITIIFSLGKKNLWKIQLSLFLNSWKILIIKKKSLQKIINYQTTEDGSLSFFLSPSLSSLSPPLFVFSFPLFGESNNSFLSRSIWNNTLVIKWKQEMKFEFFPT